MEYIACKRFKGAAIGGKVNIPAGTVCEARNDMIYYGEIAVCAVKSHTAHQYFARNDDGRGMVRWRLTQAILKKLAARDDGYQERWDKVWDDSVCKLYKREDHEYHWLWSDDFYTANLMTLKYIAHLVGAKEG